MSTAVRSLIRKRCPPVRNIQEAACASDFADEHQRRIGPVAFVFPPHAANVVDGSAAEGGGNGGSVGLDTIPCTGSPAIVYCFDKRWHEEKNVAAPQWRSAGRTET